MYKRQVQNCVNTGNVTGVARVGCGVGDNFYGTVTSCFSTGTVQWEGSSEGDSLGGVAGYNLGTVTNCYATGEAAVASGTDHHVVAQAVLCSGLGV